MAGIDTGDKLVAAMAGGQEVQLQKNATVTTLANAWFSMFDIAGDPGAGVLAGTNTANGLKPDDTTAGCPPINAFVTSGLGNALRIAYANTVLSRLRVFDMLFKAGAFNFATTTNLTSQPAISSRVRGGSDYTDCQIWLECTTAFTGNLTVTVTYTNQAGTTGRSTGAVALGFAPTKYRLVQIPLASGDSGVQKIESVQFSVSTAGAANVLIMRPIGPSVRVSVVNSSVILNAADLGMPRVFDDSALVLAVNADSTSSGTPDVTLLIGNAA